MSDYIPQPMLEEIFFRLPPTTLLRLCWVCKAWYLLIKSHDFISSHLRHSISNPALPVLLIQQFTDMPSSSQWFYNAAPFSQLVPPYPSDSPYLFRFIESLHGIVCLTEEISRNIRAIILWNPSIQKHLRLQPPNDTHKALGFGFDSKNNDFKVVTFLHPNQVQLYSLNEGSWRNIYFSNHEIELGEVVRVSDSRCFLGGNVHWIAKNVPLHRNKNNILMFNAEEEKFMKMELPPQLGNKPLCKLKVTVIEGCLSVLLYDGKPSLPSTIDWCDIWMMRDYGVTESWTKICKVHLQDGGHIFGLSTSSKVLVPWSNWEGRKSSSLHYLDPMSQELTDLGIQGIAISACEYTGSLVLLDKA